MVRQPKVRAQSEMQFLLPTSAARVKPVEGTVPIGYEMPCLTTRPAVDARTS